MISTVQIIIKCKCFLFIIEELMQLIDFIPSLPNSHEHLESPLPNPSNTCMAIVSRPSILYP